MILREILLKNFRNYENQKVIFSDSVNIITGNNGKAKRCQKNTNLHGDYNLL